MKSTLLPPPLVAALAAAGMYLGDDPTTPGAPLPAATVAAAGLTLMFWAAATLWQAHTTLNPVQPERAGRLVRHGPFAHSRNPIYLGDALLLLGWALWLGDGMALLGPVGFVAWIDRLQIAAEERALAQRFGDAYRLYCAQVRRWL
ncbi:MAG: isoprenylcysteine carboxylmethyltransferase family protein [Burkholderiaceae bacterium]|nr:isoprenylcysteine carboxylmethyltransferase family protein [Burkholderiaceae bacterium]